MNREDLERLANAATATSIEQVLRGETSDAYSRGMCQLALLATIALRLGECSNALLKIAYKRT